MVERPSNHATRRMVQRATGRMSAITPEGNLRDLSPNLVEDLETLYPPRCHRSGEDIGEHHKYAGKVELVQTLRAIVNAYADFSGDGDEDALAVAMVTTKLREMKESK